MEICSGRTIEDLYEATQNRKFKLEKKGYKIIEIWECDWKQLLKKNSSLRSKWESTFVPDAFHPRKHALRGGRVEPFCLYAEAGPDEVIEHFDVVSRVVEYLKIFEYSI